LLGYTIIVYTDHKNNTFNGEKASDHVLRGLLLLEENGVTFECLPGRENDKTMEATSNVTLKKCATIMVSLPNQLPVIILKQIQLLSESTK
jgi:hypothetical protein